MNVNGLTDEIVCECSQALILALGQKDQYTQLHSKRVVELSHSLAEALRLNKDEIKTLRFSAAFHDIGKIGIPDKVLLKDTSLNDEEWKIMKSHSTKSEEIVKGLNFENSNIIANIVRHHHEHFDGSGYPDKLKEKEIPIFSRIISIADSYDAMASPRPYHKERNHNEVLNIIKEESGIKHDPELVKLFEKIIEKSEYRVS